MSQKLVVKNNKTNKQYSIVNFTDYIVDQSLDIPADYFNFTLSNKDGKVSNLISVSDEVWFYINDKLILNGIIDDMDINIDETQNSISISGRDKISILLDNDAIPTTYNNIKVSEYLGKILPQYGITKYKVDKDLDVAIDKIAISAGQTEYSVIEDFSKRLKIKNRYDLDTFLCTKHRADKQIDYYFSNNKYITRNVILIKSIGIKLSNDIKSHVHVYGGNYKSGTTFSTSKNIKGSAIAKSFTRIKRKIMHESDLETNKQAQTIALEELKEINKNALTITLEVYTQAPIYINKVAHVRVDELGLEAYMLINKVTYSRSVTGGSTTRIELKLMEGIAVNWKNHSIPVL